MGPVPLAYSASDPHLLRWVHLAFTDSFLVTHQVWGGAIPGGPDAYVADWSAAAVPLGLDDPPRSASELAQQLSGFDDELCAGPDAREVVRFILNPPLPLAARPAYAVLAAGAVSTLEPRHREPSCSACRRCPGCRSRQPRAPCSVGCGWHWAAPRRASRRPGRGSSGWRC